ncbi:MAG TPA: hypothetical protein PKA00_19495 [Saprospiraceae bacterium]|nr:hypothetical protein [Saprospiraceae bacterium]HMQ85104.1 hypothetical protein [Saprospiraceae bacterium]
MKTSLLLCLTLISAQLFCQTDKSITMTATAELPYRQIPDAPDAYNACTVVARMIDGLGFRYYWATDSLRAEDLAYKPSEDARTSAETLDHVFSMSQTILNAVHQMPNVRQPIPPGMPFEEKRRLTLMRFKEASDVLKASSPEAIENFKIIFQSDEKRTEYDFWFLINGQISDSLWHVGQIVSFRRASGNPINPLVNVFQGRLMD